MTAQQIAEDHYHARVELVDKAVDASLARWGQVEPVRFGASWDKLLPEVMTILAGAQLAAARESNNYVGAALAAQGVRVSPDAEVVPRALAGIASDGRTLDSLLRAPAVATAEALASGATLERAMATGRATLDMIVHTQVSDAGRVADGIAVTTRPHVGWVRMLVGHSCPRCVLLAGRFYAYSDGFDRHPNDDCISIPAVEDTAGDFRTDPKKAFEEGRVRGLSRAETKAIEDGADMGQVINAKRGMSTAGGVKTTTEGATSRGLAGQRLGVPRGRVAVRPTPEAIYKLAEDRADAVRMLRRFSYII